MTPQSVFQWFAPPELPRSDLRQRARALWLVSWPFFAVVTVLLAIAVLVDPQTLVRRATTIAIVGGLMTVLHMTSRAGRPVLASWMLVIGLCVVITQRAWVVGGIDSPVAAFYVLFIVMASVLLGRRGALATAAVCTVGAIVLTAATSRGWLSPKPGAGPPLDGFVFVMLAISLALVVNAVMTLRPQREGLDAEGIRLVVGDLRSPMQAALSRLELLRGELPAESIEDVDAALGSVRALRRMTTSLLDVSRLEAGRMPIHASPTDLLALARDVVSAAHAVQPTCAITINVCGDSMCNCDRALTRRIIENLVSNATQVTATDGHACIVIADSRHGVSIAVADEGRSVSPDERSRIFEPFRTDRLHRGVAEESSGLPLAFCKLAVEAQGGTIRVENGTPRGNVFVVELPR